MTRVTNLGRKRQYLEAGFETDPTSIPNVQPASEANSANEDQRIVRPKRKWRKTKVPVTDEDGEQTTSDVHPRRERPSAGKKKATIAKKGGLTKNVAVSGYERRTERRRLKRMSDRQAETVCFACREKGHTAKECPKTTDEGVDGQKNVRTTVGICYRCGSTKHILSRCKIPQDPLDPLPFASCFVCSGKGHLASACPQNKEKGIYPDGGSCKLCGEKTHLAKDCELRKRDASGTAGTTIFGTGSGAGADEDDFHSFKRRHAEVSKDEQEERWRKRMDVKAGVDTGTVAAFGKNQVSSKSKKVVFF